MVEVSVVHLRCRPTPEQLPALHANDCCVWRVEYWPPTIQEDDRSTQVVRAWRLQNENIWRRYSQARERVADDVSRGPPLQSDDPPVCNRAKLMQPKKPGVVGPGCSRGGEQLEQAAKAGFARQPDGAHTREDVCRLDVNEAFLLHGLPKGNVADVLRNGLNERFSGANKGTLFGAPGLLFRMLCAPSMQGVHVAGQGTYFAQDIEKIDQYTREEDRAIDEADLQHLHERLYPDRDHPGDVSPQMRLR
jgi:hypothetical protein